MGLFGNLFGKKDSDAGRDTTQEGTRILKQGAAAAQEVGNTSNRRANEYAPQVDNMTARNNADLGSSATDFMNKQDTAASASAGREADMAAKGAARNAIKAAKTAGANSGQAALMASQNTGDTYQGALQKGLDSGRNRYGQATELGLKQGSELAGREATNRNLQLGAASAMTGAGNSIAGAGAAQQQAGNDKRNSTFGGIGGVLGGLGAIFSDSRLKYGTRSSEIDELIDKVKPVDFHYKDEGNDEEKHIGVIAQDLEKTEIGKPAVNETPIGKSISVEELKPVLVSLVKELMNKTERLS